tara:strand:- start:91 stop:663 length:573 start_codon:yes stop_codon:yes gene_type:complete
MNLPKNKQLIIFDFDETLCTTQGLVKRINKKTSVEDFLTPGKYSAWRETGEYDKNPNIWDLDFSDFTGYPEKGSPILDTVSSLRDYLMDDSCIVALVTGRDELLGPRQWLSAHKLDISNMILMCSGDPNKRPCFESLINTLLPKSIIIYEDCPAYISQCEEVSAKYKIPCAGILIGDGNIRWDWKIKKGE